MSHAVQTHCGWCLVFLYVFIAVTYQQISQCVALSDTLAGVHMLLFWMVGWFKLAPKEFFNDYREIGTKFYTLVTGTHSLIHKSGKFRYIVYTERTELRCF